MFLQVPMGSVAAPLKISLQLVTKLVTNGEKPSIIKPSFCALGCALNFCLNTAGLYHSNLSSYSTTVTAKISRLADPYVFLPQERPKLA